MKRFLKEILNIFPKHCYSFAYGSAVFKQSTTSFNNQMDKLTIEKNLPVKSENSKSKMIDFIIVVDDSMKWHQENLIKNN